MASERDVVQMPAELDLGTAAGGAPASAAVRANGLVFTTGYMSINPETGELEPGTAAEETRQHSGGDSRGPGGGRLEHGKSCQGARVSR